VDSPLSSAFPVIPPFAGVMNKSAVPPREVRRILVGHWMRYEIQEFTIYVLRLWHTREDR